MAALQAMKISCNRRACHGISMSDKLYYRTRWSLSGSLGPSLRAAMTADTPETQPPAMPAAPADAGIPIHLERLVETAKNYARGAKAPATLRAYAADWRHFTAWCRRKDLDALPPAPQVVGLYLAACASETTHSTLGRILAEGPCE